MNEELGDVVKVVLREEYNILPGMFNKRRMAGQ